MEKSMSSFLTCQGDAEEVGVVEMDMKTENGTRMAPAVEDSSFAVNHRIELRNTHYKKDGAEVVG